MILIRPNNPLNFKPQKNKKNSIKNTIHSCVTKYVYFIIFAIQPLLSNSTGNSDSIANSAPNSWKRNKLKKRFD